MIAKKEHNRGNYQTASVNGKMSDGTRESIEHSSGVLQIWILISVIKFNKNYGNKTTTKWKKRYGGLENIKTLHTEKKQSIKIS